MEALLVGCLRISILKVDMAGVAKKKSIWVVNPGFELQVMLGGHLCVSGPYKFHIYCVAWSKIA